MVFLKLFFIFSMYYVSVRCFECFWNAESPYRKFSSKSPYELVRGDIRDSANIVGLQSCEPISIWGLYRHGKRYPGKNFADDMKHVIDLRDSIIESHEQGRGSICAQDIENLKHWRLDRKMFTDKHGIAPEGKQEMFNLGKRLRDVYKNLLNKLSENEYKIRPVFGSWIRDSASNFIKGLGHSNLVIEPADMKFDDMAPYSMCGKYKRDVKKNISTYGIPERYKMNPEYIEAIDRVQSRLGINNSLTDQNLTALFDLCRYTWDGINNKPSPWCSLLTKSDTKVMEYIGDMRHYYRNGYGCNLSKYFGRLPLRNLYHSLKNAKNGKGVKIAAFFSHATMMDMVYTALGVFKDRKPLTEYERHEDRLWRSTELAPFSANVVAVLYKCGNSYQMDDHKVVFYRNEKPFEEICYKGVCTWKQFEERFGHFANSTVDFCEYWVKP